MSDETVGGKGRVTGCVTCKRLLTRYDEGACDCMLSDRSPDHRVFVPVSLLEHKERQFEDVSAALASVIGEEEK